MFEGKKIEVKIEWGMWIKIGNIVIEFESYGKFLGIVFIEVDYWFYNLVIEDDVYCMFVFKIDILRKIVEEFDDYKVVKGGDNWVFKMYFVNFSKLFCIDIL